MIVNAEEDGLKYKALVPDGAPEYLWSAGVRIGPPDLSGLGLPVETYKRLNNELFNRGLITERDIRKRVNELQAALQAAFKVDVQILMEAYSNARRS